MRAREPSPRYDPLPAFTLVDSNILLDIFTEDPRWLDWSSEALARVTEEGRVAINPIIFAEVAAHFSRLEELEASLPDTFERLPLPWDAAFLAGRCFVDYRRRGGVRRSPMPDFYIGAHAAIAGMSILTRDAARYRTYFPKLRVLAPDAEEMA